jgi:hypothetical protein
MTGKPEVNFSIADDAPGIAICRSDDPIAHLD